MKFYGFLENFGLENLIVSISFSKNKFPLFNVSNFRTDKKKDSYDIVIARLYFSAALY